MEILNAILACSAVLIFSFSRKDIKKIVYYKAKLIKVMIIEITKAKFVELLSPAYVIPMEIPNDIPKRMREIK